MILRIGVVTALGGLLVAGCGSGTPDHGTPAPTRTSTPSAACPSSGLRLKGGGVDAAMGARAMQLDLVSCDGRAHRVEGFPPVRTLDDARHPLDVRAVHEIADVIGPLPAWSGTPRPVTVRPGHGASVVVVWRNTYDNTDIEPVTGRCLSVTIGMETQLVTPRGGVDLGSTGRIGVSAWRRTP